MTSPKFPDVNVKMVGEDGNAFAIIGRVVRALEKAGHKEGAHEFREAAFGAGSYNEVLQLVMTTVEVDKPEKDAEAYEDHIAHEVGIDDDFDDSEDDDGEEEWDEDEDDYDAVLDG